MIGDGVVVDLADRAFLGAHHAGKIAEMVDRQRQVGGAGLTDRLAVVPGLGDGETLQILFHAIGDPVQDRGALGDAGAAPGRLGGMRRIEGRLDVLRVGARDLADDLTGHRRGVVEIFAGDRRDELAADEVVIAFGEGNFGDAEEFHLVH
jgi:hypothetical protein